MAERPRLRDVLTRWFQVLAGDLGRGFLSSRGPDGEAWPPLKRPRRPSPPRNPGSRPLIDFGRLLGSVASTAAGHIEEVQDDGGVFGTSVPYAAVHQTGNAGRNLPPRPFLGAPAETADLLAEMTADDLCRQIELL